MELINILIRTSSRPKEFLRCLKSVLSQNYANIRIIVAVDNDNYFYVPRDLEIIRVIPDRNLLFFYDCYLNDLFALVTEGYILILDDDDVLMPDCLSKIIFGEKAIIVKLRRADDIYPLHQDFKRGQIGFPNLILHYSLKDVAKISGSGQGDYFWIKEIQKVCPLTYQDLIVVYSWNRGHGKPSQNKQSIVYMG